MTKLEELIDKAAKGDQNAVLEFYRTLWETELIVPLIPNAMVEAAGVDPNSKDMFYIAAVDEQLTIPVFSKPEFVEEWAGEEIPVVRKIFRTLLWLVPNEVWLHLNPGQEMGKEFSAWELERLRDDGLEALTELAADVLPPTQGEFELNAEPGMYPDYERKLRSVLEVYTEVEEAFIITLTNTDSESTSVMVGLSQEGLQQERLELLSSEIEEMARSIIPIDVEITVVSDINNPAYPYSSLFRDAVPFYMRTEVDSSEPTIFNKVLDRYRPKLEEEDN